MLRASAAALAACALTACSSGGETLTVDGRTREYFVDAPGDASGELPLLLALHGRGGSGAQLRRATRFDEIGEREGFIAVFPSALNANWNDGRVGSQLPSNAEGIDDEEFIDEVLDAVMLRYPVDYARVYVTGASNGGIFALSMTCGALGARFAAVVSVVGGFAANVIEGCDPFRPLSVMMVNGGDDEIVPVEGGEVGGSGRGSVVSLAETLAFWVEHDGCASEPARETVDEVDDDDTALAIETWSGCERDTAVKGVVIEGGGHTWPGARRAEALEGFSGEASRELDASEAVWEFASGFSS